MVFKGFKDENGNVIPVQGAGTVYNEEKNSLALGDGTKASGKDQFVFGRNNVEDMEDAFAEIVGGGSTVQKTGFVVGDKATVAITTGNPRRPVENTLVIEYLGLRANNVVPAMLDLTSWATDPEDISSLEADYGEDYYKIKHVWSIVSATSGSYAYFLGPDLALDAQGGSNCWLFTSDAGSGMDCYTKEVTIESGTTRANIRTLDWEGNEKLAGSLTVGTGITIGETSLSQAELIALKALLNT